MTNEAKVGIFIVIVIIIFIILSVQIGELSFTKKDTYTMTMVFSSVEGLKRGSPLELAGVDVGTVTGISLNKDYSAVVTAAIYDDIRLPINSSASIATKGVLGDKIIILTPGVSENTIKPGGNLARTTVPPSVDHILMQIGELAENLAELTGALNSTFGDEDALRNIINNISRFSEDSAALVSQNQENISVTISQLREITDNFAMVSQDLAGTSADFGEIIGKINSGNGTMGRLINDEALYLSTMGFMENIQQFTSRLNEDNTIAMLLNDSELYYDIVAIAENIRFITDQLSQGRGTMGHILVDEELYQQLNEAIRNANLAAQGIEEQLPITVMGTILGLIW
ncbi:MAG TPA: MCE family protein [Deltaproteobacteria bacterium]|mgnify:CR=1 FL=1|nr:MCE family protein [Deltaproteobacteria bacterium]